MRGNIAMWTHGRGKRSAVHAGNEHAALCQSTIARVISMVEEAVGVLDSDQRLSVLVQGIRRMPVLRHREVSKPAQWVDRELVVQRSQLDRSDVTLTSERIKMILKVASERVQNHVLPFSEETSSAGVQKCERSGINLALLTVPVTLILSRLGIICSALQTVALN